MGRSKWFGLLYVLPAVLIASVLLAGCGDDDGSSPRVITVSDFEGVWVAQTYTVTSVANPQVSLEFVGLGGGFNFDVDDEGNFQGRAFVPGALMGMPLELPFQGTFELISQDSVYVEFTPEFPPFLTNTRAGFDLVGDTFTITDANTMFDFDGDQVAEPASFVGVLTKYGGTGQPVVFASDFEGAWETTTYRMTSNANPQISIELISLGASFDFIADDSGQFQGSAFIPEVVAGQDITIPNFTGLFNVVTQDTLEIVFTPEMPPFLTDLRGSFTLVGDTFTLDNPNTAFDFDGDQVEESATFEGVMVRTGTMD